MKRIFRGNKFQWEWKRSVLFLTTGVLIGFSVPTSAAGTSEYGITLPGIALRPSVTVDIGATVYVKGDRCRGRTIVAVHGLVHTAATWQPLVQALFANDDVQPRICRVVALNFPGRGGSGLPVGMVFGELLLDDYVTALLEVLARLPEHGLRPRALIAHSQGGLIIQMAQQALAARGETLRSRFDIREVTLLAPVVPREIGWALADSGTAAGLLASFVAFDPVLGLHASVPPPALQQLFFTNALGVLAPGTPSAETIVARGYTGPDPLFVAMQLIGAPPFARPSVDAGRFARRHGTTLHIVAFSQDFVLRLDELRALDAHLRGPVAAKKDGDDEDGTKGITVVVGDDAVHDSYLSDPTRVSRAIADAEHPRDD